MQKWFERKLQGVFSGVLDPVLKKQKKHSDLDPQFKEFHIRTISKLLFFCCCQKTSRVSYPVIRRRDSDSDRGFTGL
jgi:hypothetical protein